MVPFRACLCTLRHPAVPALPRVCKCTSSVHAHRKQLLANFAQCEPANFDVTILHVRCMLFSFFFSFLFQKYFFLFLAYRGCDERKKLQIGGLFHNRGLTVQEAKGLAEMNGTQRESGCRVQRQQPSGALKHQRRAQCRSQCKRWMREPKLVQTHSRRGMHRWRTEHKSIGYGKI